MNKQCLRFLIGALVTTGSSALVAQDFEFANDGSLTAPIYRYGDTAGNGQFWDGRELGNNNLQFQYSGAGQAGTYLFGIDGTFTTPSINVLNGSTFGNIIFGDTAGNGQVWNAAELVDNNLQFQYSGNGQAGTFLFGLDGRFTAPIFRFGDTAGNGQFWDAQELGDNNLQVQYTGAGQAGTYLFGLNGTFTSPVVEWADNTTNPNGQTWTSLELADQDLQIQYSGLAQAGTYNFGVDGTFTAPIVQLGDTGGNSQFWDLEELANNAFQIQYSGAGQAGTYNFGVDGTFTAPIVQLGDTGGNNQFWDLEELANNAFQIQYSGAGQAGTYNFGVDGTFTTPILQLGDTAGNNQFWDLEELGDNTFQIQYSGAGQAGTFLFGVDGILEAPVFQPADTGGNGQVWTIEELADNNLEIFYSGNPGPEVPTYIFGVNGTLTVPTLVQTSDAKFKENIEPLNNALDTINALEGIRFTWKDSGRESIGFVAQDIEQVVPQLVHTGTDGSKAVEYSKLVAVLVEALKEQQNLLDQQSQELAAFRTEMESVRELKADLEWLNHALVPESLQLTQTSR